jgi:hypothetical protein
LNEYDLETGTLLLNIISIGHYFDCYKL